MSDVNTLLTKRLSKNEQSTKMAQMAKQSARGHLTSFSGVFSVTELNDHEKKTLEEILNEYATDKVNIADDFNSLMSITSEVKAINNQAAILHGERIKKAQVILKQYHDGAFTAWLISIYGNRQTPYNFLQYYEFYNAVATDLRPQIEIMPRQAIYTLASRDAPLTEKQKIIKNYNGETKSELLSLIRERFPLDDQDQRKQSVGETAIQALRRVFKLLDRKNLKLDRKNKRQLNEILDEIYVIVND